MLSKEEADAKMARFLQWETAPVPNTWNSDLLQFLSGNQPVPYSSTEKEKMLRRIRKVLRMFLWTELGPAVDGYPDELNRARAFRNVGKRLYSIFVTPDNAQRPPCWVLSIPGRDPWELLMKHVAQGIKNRKSYLKSN